jgi:RNA polymerase sigma-70 factor (ECF subfamily)
MKDELVRIQSPVPLGGESSGTVKAAQEAATLEALWERYCCRLLAFIRRRVANNDDAEDLLQEVFLRIHQGLCCLQEWQRLESWIYQVTRNLVVDYYRRRKSTAEIPEDLPADEIPLEEDPAARLAGSLKEMIQELPERYRQALIMTEYQGRSLQALADMLGISLSGAKSRVQRARARLRDMLLACCHFELDRRGRIIDYHQRCCCCNPSPC